MRGSNGRQRWVWSRWSILSSVKCSARYSESEIDLSRTGHERGRRIKIRLSKILRLGRVRMVRI